MNAATTNWSNNSAAEAHLAGILARTGLAQGGAVVHRVRPLAAIINPSITPASPIIIVVKKSYTRPARVRITLRASGRVRQSATLTRIVVPFSANIDLFASRQSTTPISFTPTGRPNESELRIPAAELNLGKVLFAESTAPSFNLDDYRLRLSLATGPTSGDAVEVNVVAVSLTLDIHAPRTSPGAVMPALPQPPDPRPAPGAANDKWFGGLQLNSQDPGNSQQRAELRASAFPSNFPGVLLLRAVAVSGDIITGASNKAVLFEDEIPGPRQLPPITETARVAVEINAANAAFPGKQLFAEGRIQSTALRDVGFQLGIKDLENDGDRVALTVSVAPVLTVDKNIIVVKKPHTNPARRSMTVRASSTFGRTGTLTRAPGGPVIKVFNPAGNEITDLATGHSFTSTQLNAGVQLAVESTVPSGGENDIQFNLVLTPGGPVPVGAPANTRMTAVDLILDIGLTRPAPGVTPPLMSATDKINPGRFVQVRNAAFTHERAMIILRPPNPRIVLSVVLRATSTQVPPPASAQLRAFGIEGPAGGQSAHPNPVTFPSSFVTSGGGLEFFVEGTSASTAVRDTGFQYGIDGI